MAGKDGTSTHTLMYFRELEEAPYKHGFYSTLRRLDSMQKDKPRIGASLHVKDDPVRFSQAPSLSFATSTLQKFTLSTEGRPPRLYENFFGMFGPNGALPLHLTEYAFDREKNEDDFSFTRFVDIFHHRMISLFYRAWASAQPTVNLDRPESDRFALYVGSLLGIGQDSMRNRDAMPDFAKLSFSGQMMSQARDADGLLGLLSGFFQLPVEIEEFVGDWVDLPESVCCRLGANKEISTLGVSITSGTRIWDCQHKFRIIFGPVGIEDYRRMLPNGKSAKRLIALVRNYIGIEMNWELKLILKKEDVPSARLGGDDQLGWTSWSGHRTVDTDADDLLLNVSTLSRL